MTVKIYQPEIDDGLSDAILGSTTVACMGTIVPIEIDKVQLPESTKASITDIDLYPVRCILVSSVWNKNDDVFTKEELIKASKTPEHKPSNLEHDSHQIAGHITTAYLVNDLGLPIDDEKAAASESVIHIVVDSVIYTYPFDQLLKQKASDLISDIESQKKGVSMECAFSGFDYALKEADGSYTIVERDDTTAELSKHLRCFGGSGKWEDHQIGRVLKNVIFIGKGFVNNPANPDSSYIEPLSTQAQETQDMSEDYKDQVIELNTEVAQLKAKTSEFEATLATKDSEIEAANSTVSELNIKVDELKATIATLTEDKETVTTKATELEAELTKANEQLEVIKAEKVFAERVSYLVDGGSTKEVATEKVELFKALSDEQFKDIADEYISYLSTSKEKCEEEVDEKDDEEKDSKGEESVEASEDKLDEAAQSASLPQDDTTQKEVECFAIASCLTPNK